MSNIVRLHRVLRAPPERVYRAFLDPDAMVKWLPPHGYTGKVHHMDARVGGSHRMSFTNFSTGSSHAFGGRYVELTPHERIRYTDQFDDPAMPGEMQVTHLAGCGRLRNRTHDHAGGHSASHPARVLLPRVAGIVVAAGAPGRARDPGRHVAESGALKPGRSATRAPRSQRSSESSRAAMSRPGTPRPTTGTCSSRCRMASSSTQRSPQRPTSSMSSPIGDPSWRKSWEPCASRSGLTAPYGCRGRRRPRKCRPTSPRTRSGSWRCRSASST